MKVEQYTAPYLHVIKFMNALMVGVVFVPVIWSQGAPTLTEPFKALSRNATHMILVF